MKTKQDMRTKWLRAVLCSCAVSVSVSKIDSHTNTMLIYRTAISRELKLVLQSMILLETAIKLHYLEMTSKFLGICRLSI